MAELVLKQTLGSSASVHHGGTVSTAAVAVGFLHPVIFFDAFLLLSIHILNISISISFTSLINQ